MKYRAAVVGLGRIGQGYDYDAPVEADGPILTHCRAFHLHPGFELIGGVDSDATQRERFSRKYGLPVYATQAAMLEAEKPEVVAVCSPTTDRTPLLLEAIGSGARAVVAEKPLADNVDAARKIVSAAQQRSCQLLVNFIRRFEPGALRLRSMIQQGDLGPVFKVVAFYSNGLRNNASHLVDLLRYMLGESRSAKVMAWGPVVAGGDVEPDFAIDIGSVPVYAFAAKEHCYSLFEFQLLGEKGRVHYANGGAKIEIDRAGEDPLFPGFRALAERPVCIANEMHRYQWHVADALHRNLSLREPIASDGESALGTLAAIESIADQCR